MSVSPPQQTSPIPFTFSQYPPPPILSTATRQISAAAYLDPEFAGAVIREVVEDEHRAVPPSYGFDLGPILRHCFRARRLLLFRDALLAATALVGLLVAPVPIMLWLTVGFTVLVVRSRRLRHLSLVSRIWLVMAVLFATSILPCLLTLLAFAQLGTGGNSLSGQPDTSSSSTTGGAVFTAWLGAFGLALNVIFLVLPYLIVFAFRLKTYAIFSAELRDGQPQRLPDITNTRIAHRIATVGSIQRGNITVQERDPFIGSGQVRAGWSFTVPLRRHAVTGSGRPDRTTIHLDAVALNRSLRAALLRLSDESLPESSRIPGLYLAPHIAADGVRGLGDPLLHPQVRLPFTVASEEAVDAIISHPQAGLRYYERVVIGVAGRPLTVAGGHTDLPAQDLGIDVSAFVHVAVEGGMLYAEFMATVMPPIQQRYQMLDQLRPERVVSKAFLDSVLVFPAETAASGWRLLRNGWRIATTGLRMTRADRESQEYRVYDYGARLSVRELAAEAEPYKFLQQLDEWKYSKILSRTVSDTIVDFLEDNGVDTSDFRQKITHVENHYGTVNNINGSQVAFGGSNSFTQNNAMSGKDGAR
jgi:hypothetical protein